VCQNWTSKCCLVVQTTGVRIKFLLRAKGGFPTFFDRPSIDVCRSHISMSSTIPLAFPTQSFCPGHCHCTIMATVLVPQRDWALGVCTGHPEEWLPGEQDTGMARRAMVYSGYCCRHLQKGSVCNKTIRKKCLNKAFKNYFNLGLTFLMGLSCSYLSGLYSMPCLSELFFFKYKPS